MCMLCIFLFGQFPQLKKSFNSALNQPIVNLASQGFSANCMSHAARGTARGSTMVIFIFF